MLSFYFAFWFPLCCPGMLHPYLGNNHWMRIVLTARLFSVIQTINIAPICIKIASRTYRHYSLGRNSMLWNIIWLLNEGLRGKTEPGDLVSFLYTEMRHLWLFQKIPKNRQLSIFYRIRGNSFQDTIMVFHLKNWTFPSHPPY